MNFLDCVLGDPPAGAPSLYSIARSVLFNSPDGKYLTRTFGAAGNRQKFTWSGWVKRTVISARQTIFDSFASAAGHVLEFQANDTLLLYSYGTGPVSVSVPSAQLFRDPGAWYHIVLSVDTTQATAANRVVFYVNGIQIALGSTTYPAQNDNLYINNNIVHNIGRRGDASIYFDGYMAEVYFIDGTALAATDFGQFQTSTGAWIPKAPTGLTFGTNGFWLSFANNASTATAGYDDAGGVAGAHAGSKDWTLASMSVAAGANNDSVTDTPTNNFCILNPIATVVAATVSNGSLKQVGGVDGYSVGNWGMTSGKWYWEQIITTAGAISTAGIENTGTGVSGGGNYVGSVATSWGYVNSGNKANNASAVAYGASWTTGDVIGIAFDADNGKLFFAKNNVWQNSGDPVAGTNAAYTGLTSGPYYPAIGARNTTSVSTNTINFGQLGFSYTPPTGFSALSTANFPSPALPRASYAFDVDLYTSTGSARTKTGLNFAPDLIWLKGRTGVRDHAIYDSVRGAQADIGSNLATAETSQAQGVTAFTSDGYSIGTLAKLNTNTEQFAAWLWKKGVTPGFDIVTYTGNGSNRTINHSLGVAPRMVIIKSRSGARSWFLWHAGIANTGYLTLDGTGATTTDATVWNSTSPTSSVFSLGTHASVNTNAETYVAYLFADVPGFSRIGTYAGNSAASGPFVFLGFRPKFIILKRATTGGNNWRMRDSLRDTYNGVKANLYPNATGAEDTTDGLIDILSTGFKLRENLAAINNTGDTYIYAAFADVPLKYTTAR